MTNHKLATDVLANIKVNSDDLVSIAVTEQEDKLLQELDILSSQQEAVQGNINSLCKAFITTLEKTAETEYEKKHENLCKELSSFTDKEIHQFYEAAINLEEVSLEKGELPVSLFLRTSKRSSTLLSKQLQVPLNKELKQIVESFYTSLEEKKNLYTSILQIKKEQADLPRLARKARASIARTVLEATDEGRKLVLAVTNSVSAKQITSSTKKTKKKK